MAGVVTLPIHIIKGRGAATCVPHWFERDVRDAYDDGWGTLEADIRLPWELAPLFRQWLDLRYPQRAARVVARIQEMHGGKDYDSDFASRMKGHVLWADPIRQRFEKTCHRIGFNQSRVELDLSQFRPGAVTGQDSLF